MERRLRKNHQRKITQNREQNKLNNWMDYFEEAEQKNDIVLDTSSVNKVIKNEYLSNNFFKKSEDKCQLNCLKKIKDNSNELEFENKYKIYNGIETFEEEACFL